MATLTRGCVSNQLCKPGCVRRLSFLQGWSLACLLIRGCRASDELQQNQTRGDFEVNCPYARSAPSLGAGNNLLEVTNLQFGRTGNRFTEIAHGLAVGFCCKSEVMLPEKDGIIAPGVFNTGTSGPRWFDFGDAPDASSFNASLCRGQILIWNGQGAYYESGLEVPGLRECAEGLPRMRGCEAAYFFPVDIDVCGWQFENFDEGVSYNHSRYGEHQPNHALMPEYNEESKDWGYKTFESAGTLVIHIRSGDIFGGAAAGMYGQPPLQFYYLVIRHQRWDRIEIVSNGNENPVIGFLLKSQAAGELGRNVHIYTNRSAEQDFRSLLCADGLALARSTLTELIAFHTTAVRVYVPDECQSKTAMEIAKNRPGIEVYGVSAPGYTVYNHWNGSDAMRQDMMTFNNSGPILQCT